MTAVAANAERHSRKGVLAAVLLLISLPGLLALTEAVSFYATNRSNGTMVSAGIEREYLLYVPTTYDPAKPTPLVISLHGGAMWPAAQMEIDRWNRIAEEHGFLLVYPSAVSGRGPRSWRSGAERGPMRDVRYISELIDTLRASYSIDSTRIYASGLSNGGGMAFKLACTLSYRIAAVGMVGTAIFLPWSECTDQRPVPISCFTAPPIGLLSTTAVRRGWPPTCFRASRAGPLAMRCETDASQPLWNGRLPRMSRVSSTRGVRRTQR